MAWIFRVARIYLFHRCKAKSILLIMLHYNISRSSKVYHVKDIYICIQLSITLNLIITIFATVASVETECADGGAAVSSCSMEE